MGRSLKVNKEIKDTRDDFLKNVDSEMDYRSLFQSDLLVFDWVDEMEFACPYIDIIVRNPKLTLIQEKNVVKVERAKRVNVDSVKNLAKNTHYINKIKDDQSVEPKKILEVRNEETFNIYENRFLYTLIDDMARFIRDKEQILNHFELIENKRMEYAATTKAAGEKIHIEVAISSESLPNQKIDKKLEEEIKKVKKRLKRIKDYISSWYHSPMMKQLEREHVKPIKPPLKKTNITLKNPNFRIAARLWDFIRAYDLDEKENNQNNTNLNDSIELLKGFLDHSFFIDYSVLNSMNTQKRMQKKTMTEYALVILTEEVHRIVSLLLSNGVKITDEELLALIAKEIKSEKKERLVGSDDVKKKFQTAMDEYLERMQKNL